MTHDDPDRPNQHDHSHGSHSHERAGASSIPDQHKARGPKFVRAYVVTCSDSRTPATDSGGKAIKDMLAEGGHVVVGAAIIPDDPARIADELENAKRSGAQVVLFTGGTGISSRDRTFDAVSAAIQKPLPGFGELFRMLSFDEIGSAAMLSRAVAGVARDGLLVFAMPGSPAAVKLACERLILPELSHLLEELGR
jgi:molybdenum cofactor biosynthesis protein B